MNVQDAIALVTGGGSGLGRATALRLGRGGARVVVADLPSSPGADVAAELGESGLFVPTDVTSEADVARCLDEAGRRFGVPNAVVQCAGIAIAEKVIGKEGLHSLERFMKVLAVNTGGTFNVARLASARMIDTTPNAFGERGVFVHTASVAAFEGQIGQVAYAASKGAVRAMTLPLARELARHGIRVNTIAPGIFKTPMMAGLPEKAQASLAEQVPFPPRLGDPDEFAHLVQAILENPMLNGETIRLDGAIRMAPR